MTCLQLRTSPVVRDILHRQFRRIAKVHASPRSVVASPVEESAALFAVLAPEVPPEVPPPSPYVRPGSILVSEKFIAALRRDYGLGRRDDEGRRIGALVEVRLWLDGLRPGLHQPEDPTR